MAYALVINGTIQALRGPGRLETKLGDGAKLGPPDTGWTPELAALCGFLPVVETVKPAPSGPDRTHDRSVSLAAGVPTVTWTERAMTAQEIADRDAAAAEAASDLTARNQLRALLRSPPPANLAQAQTQVEGLKTAVRHLALRVLGIAAGDE